MFVVLSACAALFWVVRRWRDRKSMVEDPLTDQQDAVVYAVDLSSSWASRHSGDGSDAVSARAVARSGVRSPEPQEMVFVSGWCQISDLPRPIARQVLVSTVVISPLAPNIRFGSPQEKAEAMRQMRHSDSGYRFILTDPVPVTVRTSAAGRVEFDY